MYVLWQRPESVKLSMFQCSHCFKIYSFNDWIKLKTKWIDKKNKQYGKTTICLCGQPFHLGQWHLKTEKDGYLISTIHLEIAHFDNVDFHNEEKMWYETMICKMDTKVWSSFQARYPDRTKAEQGHALAVKNLQYLITDSDKYPKDIITQFLKLTSPEKKY
ncbi:MAG TPA: hypothetical protein VJ044_16605 [Candidatus Hodarchaeales archaeon]|nr:hypothetical protein [Candidatus Hodarchaeales archaeon]